MLKRTTLILVVATASLAGCFGGGDAPTAAGPTDGSGTNDNETGNGTGLDVDVSGNATVDGNNTTAGDEAGSWGYDNRTGSVSGAALVASGPEEEETFDVVPGALSVAFDVGAEGSALEVWILPPGCSEESCAVETGSTASGNVTFESPSPEEGTWTVRLQAASPGMADADYEVTFAVLEPAA